MFHPEKKHFKRWIGRNTGDGPLTAAPPGTRISIICDHLFYLFYEFMRSKTKGPELTGQKKEKNERQIKSFVWMFCYGRKSCCHTATANQRPRKWCKTMDNPEFLNSPFQRGLQMVKFHILWICSGPKLTKSDARSWRSCGKVWLLLLLVLHM